MFKRGQKRKGDDTMASMIKPIAPAFRLSQHKANRFLKSNKSASDNAIKRFEAHRPKDGIVTPDKK